MTALLRVIGTIITVIGVVTAWMSIHEHSAIGLNTLLVSMAFIVPGLVLIWVSGRIRSR